MKYISVKKNGFLLVEAALAAAFVSVSLISILGLFRQVSFAVVKMRDSFLVSNVLGSQASYVRGMVESGIMPDFQDALLEEDDFEIRCKADDDSEKNMIYVDYTVRKKNTHMKKGLKCAFFAAEEETMGLH